MIIAKKVMSMVVFLHVLSFSGSAYAMDAAGVCSKDEYEILLLKQKKDEANKQLLAAHRRIGRMDVSEEDSIKEVVAALDAGADINRVMPSGNTVLYQAVAERYAFSATNWTRKYHVEIVLNRFISMFEFDQTFIKSHPDYNNILEFGNVKH